MDPNNVQTGFAAMNKNLNGMKGWMFSQKFTDATFGKIYDTDDKIIQGLKSLCMTKLITCLQKATNVFQSSPLYGEDKFKIDPSHLSWRATTIPLQKRGLVFVRDKTCVPPSNTKSSTSASSTTISSTNSFTSSSSPPTKTQPSSTGTSDPKPSAVPKPTATPQPQRTCSLHLWQERQYDWRGGRGIYDYPDELYFVKVKIFDGTGEDKKEIGHHDRAEAGDADPLRVTIDKLTDQLVITPEVRHGYVQFGLGKQGWASSDDGSCKVGGWDPRDDFPATRQMDWVVGKGHGQTVEEANDVPAQQEQH
ncbi:MAG: hypothetical protein L6R36_006703 [Xanthoria steineri]|nr:MAG: hypothetical protein L6R36_006703 [Xanthoria steineri]